MAKKYLNPSLKKQLNPDRFSSLDVAALAIKISEGDRASLSTGITLVESELYDHIKLSRALLSRLEEMKLDRNSLRIAISGSPGAGKSTLIESLSKFRPESSLAILAVDPSSSTSHGSILGDKTRMESLVLRKNAFIRPSPAGKTLGGVTATTQETIFLCESAGFEYIFVETVGVGQSETAVSEMVDFFILLILPGSGDEVQGIKRGIVELADMVLITKTDGDRIAIAKESRRAYKNALHLFRQKYKNWEIPVLTCSSETSENMEEIWNKIADFRDYTETEIGEKMSWKTSHRKAQKIRWYNNQLEEIAITNFLKREEVQKKIKEQREQIKTGENQVWRLLFELGEM